MDEKTFEMLSVIAARKGAYYMLVRNDFLEYLKKKNALPKSHEEQQEMRRRLRQAIAKLPNELFISPTEGTYFNKNIKLQDLNLNTKEIFERLKNELTE